MTVRRVLCILGALLVLTGLGRDALAERAKRPSKKELAAARKHFQAAEAAKSRGEYPTAASEYLAAYELFPEPEFLFNVGEVYRLGGDEQNALLHYQRYLELDPDGRGAAAARAASEELRRSLAAREAVAPPPEKEPPPPATAPPPPVERPAIAAPPPVRDEAPRRRPGRGLKIAGLATAGAGVAALAAGVVFGLKARSISDEAGDWDTFDPDRYDQGEAAERNMLIFGAAGAAAVITGGVLFYLGHRAGSRADDRAITVAPSVGARDLGVVASGRF